MSTEATWIELHIDVGTARKQRAKALGSLLPAELVQAVLAQFRDELAYLSANPAEYQLLRGNGGAALQPEMPIAEQLGNGDQLFLDEVAVPLPDGCRRTPQPIYLREQQSSRVYRLPWVPAVIGRPDPGLEGNQLLSVNLESLPAGPRVSRRHALLSEKDGTYFLESLSPNPVSIRDASGAERAVAGAQQALHDGDVIVLERSGIELLLIVRKEGPDDGH